VPVRYTSAQDISRGECDGPRPSFPPRVLHGSPFIAIGLTDLEPRRSRSHSREAFSGATVQSAASPSSYFRPPAICVIAVHARGSARFPGRSALLRRVRRRPAGDGFFFRCKLRNLLFKRPFARASSLLARHKRIWEAHYAAHKGNGNFLLPLRASERIRSPGD